MSDITVHRAIYKVHNDEEIKCPLHYVHCVSHLWKMKFILYYVALHLMLSGMSLYRQNTTTARVNFDWHSF